MRKRKYINSLLSVLTLTLLTSCATYRPSNVDNICQIFRGETDWYEAARETQEKWGTPIWLMMAFMHQESRFVEDAKPPRDWFLFIPLPRKSSAYGYAQAQDPAWEDFVKQTGARGHDRDDFEDAIDFIGWYTDATQKKLGISKWNAYDQYLAYHEGRGGYKKGSWKNKPALKRVANKVKQKAATYNAQLKTCKAELDDAVDSWFF